MKHDQLTTFGLLKEHSKNELREWIYQLIGQEVLVQAGDEYPILKLNDGSWEVMRKQRPVRLMQAAGRSAKEKPEKSKAEATSWEGVDRDLFEELRSLRLKLATERGVPPYIVFSDATLRELARVRPSTREKLRLIYGIGERKLSDLGDIVLRAIASWCEDKGLAMDQRISEPAAPPPRSTPTGNSSASAAKSLAMILFTKGASIDDVIQRTARAKSTVLEYLAEYIQQAKPVSINEWVHPEIYKQIAGAIKRAGTMRLRPVFIELGEKVPYDVIRLVAAHLAPSETET